MRSEIRPAAAFCSSFTPMTLTPTMKTCGRQELSSGRGRGTRGMGRRPYSRISTEIALISFNRSDFNFVPFSFHDSRMSSIYDDQREHPMAWPTRKDLLKYAYNQLIGNFLGFIVGASAARFVST